MLTKNDIINELLSLKCSIDKTRLNKMKKHELELLLKNYSLTPEIQTRRPKEINYDFSSSESETEDETEDKTEDKTEDETDDETDLVKSVINSKQYSQKPKQKKYSQEPKVDVRASIKNICSRFTNNVNSLVSDFKNDKDSDYLVDQYNILYNDVEHELNSYLTVNNGSNSDYNFADSLLQVQNNRIKRLVK